MSKFLTPPVWYDSVGTLNEMLTGTSIEEDNIVIGKDSSSDVNVFNSIVIGGKATGGSGSSGQISIGGETSASNTIAIGPSTVASAANSIVIGAGATATTQNTIQFGNNNTAYTLNIGNGSGVINGASRLVTGTNGVDIGGSVDSSYVTNIRGGVVTTYRVGFVNNSTASPIFINNVLNKSYGLNVAFVKDCLYYASIDTGSDGIFCIIVDTSSSGSYYLTNTSVGKNVRFLLTVSGTSTSWQVIKYSTSSDPEVLTGVKIRAIKLVEFSS